MAVLYGKKHRKWRTALSLLLVFCLVAAPLSLGGLAARAADAQEFDIGVNPDSVKAVLSPDGSLVLSGVGETRDYTPETAPFAGLFVTSVEIGGGVSSLGAYLFYGCGSLTGELALPDGLSSIGDKAFSGGSEQDAPRFSLIRNEFTQCTVTEKKEEESAVPEASPSPSLSPAPETSEAESSLESVSSAPEALEDPEAPVSSQAAEPASPEPSFTPEPTQAPAVSSQPEESGVEPEPSSTPEISPDPTASPSPEVSPAPFEEPVEDEKQYKLETITQQRMGEAVFYPGSGEGACFVCSEENASFREAAQAAGYQEADRLVPAAFDCGEGEGGTVVKELPVKDGMVVLPQMLPEFSAPQGGDLYSYSFGGWVESLDDAGVVREAGSSFQAGAREELYFIASWNREVLIKLSVKTEAGVMTLAVPEIQGYEIISYRWQICQEAGASADEDLLLWEDLPEETGPFYSRELEPGDETRAFRCVVTVKKQSFFSFFNLNGGEEVALAAVSGAQAYAAAGQHQITFSPGTGFGAMDPIIVKQGDYGVIPACAFTAPSGTNIVFDGWEDAGGTIYDPGQIVPMTADLALTARWGAATIRYVSNSGSQSNNGQSASAPCRYFKAANNGAYKDFPAGGSKYTNIVVVCGNMTLGTGNYALDAKNATITSLDPSTGTKHNVTLTVSGRSYLEGDTCFRDIKIVGGGSSEGDSIYAKGHRLYMGSGIDLTEYYANGVNLYGGDYNTALASDTSVLVTSGTYLAAFGGSELADVTGNSSVQISGEARVGVVFGGGWNWNGSKNNGNTEVLVSGSAQVGMAVGGNRSSDSGSGVTGSSHVMIGGSASVTDFNGQTKDHPKNIFNTIGFVGGSGADASDNEETGGNVRQGTLVEIRENAHVDDNVYGGSGDGWARVPSASHPTWMGTKGDMRVVVAGTPTISGGVYGGGNKRACEGNSVITIEGGTIGSGVYGGGNKAHITGGSTITITGGSIGGSVYGGGDQGDLTGNSSVTVSGEASVGGSVYGGGKNGAVGGSAAVEISGGSVGSIGADGTPLSGCGNVYGGGQEGTVGAGSTVRVSGGSVKDSVYGGSKGVSTSSNTGKVTGNSGASITGGSLGAVDDIGNPIAGTGNVYGGGEYAATTGEASVTVGGSGGSSASFSLQGSVYGGGSLAPVGSSAVEILAGEIKGSVFGAGWGAQSSTGEASVTLNGGMVDGSVYGGGELGPVGSATAPGNGVRVTLSGGTVGQSLFGAGKGNSSGSLTDGCVYGPVHVNISGGEVQGTVYGGGDNGTVGMGSLSGAGAAASLSTSVSSSTAVTMTGGTVLDSVFGGGSGSSSDSAFGAVFGSTTVDINGGSVVNGVYGGCNTAYIGGNTTVNVKASQGDLSIGGTVFGGGNLPLTGSSEGDIPTFQEIYLVQGGAKVTVDGSGTHALSVGGSVYGSGNLTLVKDHSNTTITIKNFNGALESVQRAGRADIIASNLYLVGAIDVTEAETHKYSLSQIDNLRLADKTLLRVDREARELGAIGNYVSSGTDMAVSSDSGTRSTLQVYQGKKLQIKRSDGAYGPVSGVLWLDVVAEEGAASGEVGVSIQASADTHIGDGETDTGAFVKADTDASRDLPLVSGLIAGSHTFWQLGSKTFTVNETIKATHADNGGTGLATQVFHLSTSDISTRIVITQRVQNGGFFLVKPTEKADGSMDALPALEAGQTAGNTFALRMEATDSGGVGSWTDTGAGCYILTADDSNNGGAPGIWRRGSSYLASSGAGEEGEFTFSLLYDPAYTAFTGGTVELTIKEYPLEGDMTEETLESTTVLTLTLEGDAAAGAVRQSFVKAGREFSEIDGTQPVSVAATGAVTAYFSTQYLPLSADAQNMRLTLYRLNGETRTEVPFPNGSRVVLADLSAKNRYYYYMLRPSGDSSLALSRFASMGGSGSAFYPGPASVTTQITEKLLFSMDFSECETRLEAGQYELRLSHSQTEAAMQTAGFTISSVQKPSLEVSLSKTGAWAIEAEFTPTVSGEYTRFANGALVKLFLMDSSGNILGFPGKTKYAGAEQVLRSSDGSVSFPIPLSGATAVTLDFSDVPSETLPTGRSYGLRAELRPRTGLQITTDAGTADHTVSLASAFTLEGTTKPERAVSVTLNSGERIVDVSKGSAVLKFTLSAQTESGDTPAAVICRKDGEGPGEESYTETGATWCSVSPLSSGTAAATLTVPKGTASGTYRVVFQIWDVNGTVVAEEPYNFIVK